MRFMLPATYEGFNYPPVKAIAIGPPVIMSATSTASGPRSRSSVTLAGGTAAPPIAPASSHPL